MTEPDTTLPPPEIFDSARTYEALAAVDEHFLWAMTESDLPACAFRDWLAAMAQTELERRTGNEVKFPDLQMPVTELGLARAYCRQAARLLHEQRMGWKDDVQCRAGSLRAEVMSAFEFMLLKVSFSVSQELPDPIMQKLLKIEASATIAAASLTVLCARDGRISL